jgi:hypothetical protein
MPTATATAATTATASALCAMRSEGQLGVIGAADYFRLALSPAPRAHTLPQPVAVTVPDGSLLEQLPVACTSPAVVDRARIEGRATLVGQQLRLAAIGAVAPKILRFSIVAISAVAVCGRPCGEAQLGGLRRHRTVIPGFCKH